jgi:hypothetical protein
VLARTKRQDHRWIRKRSEVACDGCDGGTKEGRIMVEQRSAGGVREDMRRGRVDGRRVYVCKKGVNQDQRQWRRKQKDDPKHSPRQAPYTPPHALVPH